MNKIHIHAIWYSAALTQHLINTIILALPVASCRLTSNSLDFFCLSTLQKL